MQRFIKSVFWLVGCTGLGFVLLQLTQPTDIRFGEVRKSSQFTGEQNRQAQLFMDRLKEASQK